MEMESYQREITKRLSLGDKRGLAFSEEILNHLEAKNISACFMCRTCSSSCPVAALEGGFDPLRLIRMCLYGLWEDVLNEPTLWLCTSCYACQERCPQNIKIADFITLLKNSAMKKGDPPAGVKAQREIIIQAGRVYPIDDFDNKKRAKMGLPELPTTCDVVARLIGGK